MKKKKKTKKIWDADASVRQNVGRRLPKMARKYLASGTQALEGQSSWEEMHEFRLATKRFRYSVELFGPLYGPGVDTRLEDLRTIQTMLGEANDCIVTAAMLGNATETASARERLQEKAEAKTKKLRAWWRASFHAAAAQERWISYFARPKRAAH